MNLILETLTRLWLYDVWVFSRWWLYVFFLWMFYLPFFFLKWMILTAPVWLPFSIILGIGRKK